MDLMEGIHLAREVLEEITLIKSSGMQDALGQLMPHPNTSFPWSAQLVEDLFQLGETIESSRADFVVDGQPNHYSMLVPVTSEVNNRGLNPVGTTTSLSSSSQVVTDLTLRADTLALHEGKNPT